MKYRGPQPGQQGRRGEVQGGQGGLRICRRQEARNLRPLRPRGRPQRRRRFGGAGGGASSAAFRRVRRHLRRHLRGAAGSGSRRSNVYRSADLRYSMEIRAFERAARHATEITVPSWESCETCHGSGTKPGTKPQGLPHLRRPGHGAHAAGFFSIQQTCPTCHGTGKVIPDPCSNCDGVRRVKEQDASRSRSRRASTSGMRIRLANGRARHQRRAAGDLFVEIQVKEHRSSSATATTYCEIPSRS